MPWNAVVLRVAIALTAAVAIWRGTRLLSGEAYNPSTHLLLGVAISAAVLATVALLLRFDRLRWRGAGHHGIAANLHAFALGATLWLLPALVGATACIALGWSSASLLSSPGTLLVAIPPLMLGVFLLEAFPEELLLRGYVQGLVARRAAQWVALLLQAALFTTFAWLIGALDSAQQWMFIPCLGLILGYVRALTGNVWACMGVHTAWMTTTQLAAAHLAIEGLQTLQFFAFALLPSAVIGSALGILRPDFSWRTPAAA